MKRHVSIFLGTFIAGAVIAFGARAALHDPHAEHAASSTAVAAETAPAAQDQATPAVQDHSAHGAARQAGPSGEQAKPAADKTPVNTVCAICGMKVDPKIPTETYQGKTVGFGCAACPPLFRADPDKYGPAALRDEVVED